MKGINAVLAATEHQFVDSGNPCLNALVLDDSTFDRRRLTRLLDASNYLFNFCEVTRFEEFLAMMENTHFDVVFSDFELPDGNGHDVLRQLGKCKRGLETCCIMVTSNDSPEVWSTAMHLGCAAFLAKDGLRQQPLTSALEKALKLRNCRQGVSIQEIFVEINARGTT